MLGLPGATPVKDLAMFKQLFSDARLQPDQIKFYPTIVTRGSLLIKAARFFMDFAGCDYLCVIWNAQRITF